MSVGRSGVDAAVRRALEEAEKTSSSGDVPVGAVGRLGSWRLSGCTLAVTLEPCTMCAGAIVLARIERLIYGARDERAGAVGSLWDVVRDRRLNHRPEVIPPDLVDPELSAACSRLLTDFFARHRTR